jgi:hypothetical protein
MPIYLPKDTIRDLINHRNRIFQEHQTAFNKYNIDILSNDILSSLSMWEIISQYDQDYEPNFHRNGEDGRSKSVLIERKCSTKLPNKKGLISNSGWQFHAQETDKSNRYIFAVRRKDNLEIVRIYDIKTTSALKKIRACLQEGRQKWIDRGKPNHDAIVVPEKLLKTIKPSKIETINNCQVIHL